MSMRASAVLFVGASAAPVAELLNISVNELPDYNLDVITPYPGSNEQFCGVMVLESSSLFPHAVSGSEVAGLADSINRAFDEFHRITHFQGQLLISTDFL